MPEAATGCVAPAGSVLATGGPAFTNGEFGNIKLSDYRGQWVVLCFYPGDFTFV
jgi:alkyl hydroperoxide reductase subunit AhpC